MMIRLLASTAFDFSYAPSSMLNSRRLCRSGETAAYWNVDDVKPA